MAIAGAPRGDNLATYPPSPDLAYTPTVPSCRGAAPGTGAGRRGRWSAPAPAESPPRSNPGQGPAAVPGCRPGSPPALRPAVRVAHPKGARSRRCPWRARYGRASGER